MPRPPPACVRSADAVALQAGAALHLGLHLAQAGEDGVDVAVADRGALAQDGVQQPAGGGDLRVEVAQDVGAEGGRGGGGQRGAHVPASLRFWAMVRARPRPPADMMESAMTPGSICL